MAKRIPAFMSDAQTLPALMNAVLNSSVVDNGAVVVGLLPKHRCCAGGCYEVESKEITHDLKELQDNKHSFKEGVESQEGGAKSQQHRHCLVGIWQDSYTLDDIIMVETVQDKPGYIFGKVICGNFYGNARKGPHFWFKTGDGISKEMEGQFSYGSPAHAGWAKEKLYWRSIDKIEISRTRTAQDNTRYTRMVMDDVSNLVLD